ncbi:MAG: hypothetical protein ACXV8Q_17785 [Methylobacter sp.]
MQHRIGHPDVLDSVAQGNLSDRIAVGLQGYRRTHSQLSTKGSVLFSTANIRIVVPAGIAGTQKPWTACRLSISL